MAIIFSVSIACNGPENAYCLRIQQLCTQLRRTLIFFNDKYDSLHENTQWYRNPFTNPKTVVDIYDEFGHIRLGECHPLYQLWTTVEKPISDGQSYEVRPIVMNLWDPFRDFTEILAKEAIPKTAWEGIAEEGIARTQDIVWNSIGKFKLYALVRAFLFLEAAKPDSPFYKDNSDNTNKVPRSPIAKLRDIYMHVLGTSATSTSSSATSPSSSATSTSSSATSTSSSAKHIILSHKPIILRSLA
jgi:hypothetical protein